MNDPIVSLEILSWKGYDCDASHLYAILHGDDRYIEIERTLTAKEAKELNKKDKDSSFSYDKTCTTMRFTDENELIKVVKKIWKKEFPHAKLLVRGSGYFMSIQKPLDGNLKLIKKVKKLYDEAEALDYYSGADDKRMEEIDDEYYKLLGVKFNKFSSKHA